MNAAAPASQSSPTVEAAQAAGRPTVFIGLGGAAAAVLKKLRRRLERRTSDDGNLRLLAIDTDLVCLRRAQEKEDGIALAGGETLHLPLRQPAEYRQASDEILSWLSRRWLYSIPRSLGTEGLRPLGRLAFVDHREVIAGRLRSLIAGAAPRVFIVASIDGGAGGGMLLDTAYAVRQQLDQFKLHADCFCGLMLHATLASSPSNDLRKANAYATLTELNHFMQGGAAFHSGPVEILPSGDVSEPPFQDAYLVHLGDELNPAQFEASLDAVAEYLYLNATCGAEPLDQFRRSARPGRTGRAPVRLRAFGLHALRVDKHAVARAQAQRWCLRLVQSWSGDTIDESSARSRLQPPAFGLEQLNERVQSLVDQALGGNAEAHFRSLLIETGFTPTDDGAAGRFGDVLRRVHAVLGTPIANADQPRRTGRLDATLAGGTKKIAAAMGGALVDSIEQLVDQPQARLPAALAGTNLYQQHLRDLRQAAEQLLDREQERAQSIRLRLERGNLPSERFWFSRLTSTSAKVEDGLLDYCRLLLRVLVCKQMVLCLQEMSAMLGTLNDRLLALRQSLRLLSEEFAKPAAAQAACLEPDDLEPVLTEWLKASLDNGHCFSERDLCKDGLLTLAEGARGGHDFGKLLRETAESAVHAALDGVAAGSLLAERYPAPCQLQDWFATAAAKTASNLAASSVNDQFLVVLPRGANYDLLKSAVERSLSDSIAIASDDGDVVLLREREGIALTEVAATIAQCGDPCEQAARRVLTRLDVAWSPLQAQPITGQQ